MKTLLISILAILGISGCAGSGGSTTIGPDGLDSTLSKNKIEGLYLFKIETNTNHINISSSNDVKVEK